MDKASNFSEAVEQKIFMHPGHIINIVHHLVLINLLPVELSYIIKGVAVRERIKPGKSVPLHNVCTNVIYFGTAMNFINSLIDSFRLSLVHSFTHSFKHHSLFVC